MNLTTIIITIIIDGVFENCQKDKTKIKIDETINFRFR